MNKKLVQQGASELSYKEVSKINVETNPQTLHVIIMWYIYILYMCVQNNTSQHVRVYSRVYPDDLPLIYSKEENGLT